MCWLNVFLKAYAYQPIAWSTGGILGPMIGGTLARPAEQFPAVFGNSKFLKEYPYFLPCAIPATFSALAWVLVFFYMKETLKSPIPISEFFSIRGIEREQAPFIVETDGISASDEDKPLPLRSLLIPTVLLAAANYAMLALVDIAYRAILPVFLATPIAIGGLGLEPFTIGIILSIYGILAGIVEFFFFANIHDYFGTKTTFMMGIASGIPVFATFPLLSYLAKRDGLSTMVWAVIGIQTVIAILLNFSYGK